MTTRISKRLPQLQVPAEVQKFKKQKTAETVKNADGSVTKRRSTAKTSKELTTREGKLLEKSTEYRRSQTTARGNQTDSTFTDKNDMLGRRSLEHSRESVSATGDRRAQLDTRDVFGIDKRQTERNTTRESGNTTTSSTVTTSRDSRGNAAKSSDVTAVTQQDKTTITTNRKDARGTDLTTRSSTTYEDGKFRLSDGADWSSNKSIERSFMREAEFDSKPITDKADKVTPWIGKIFKALGLEQTWESAVSPDRMRENTLYSSDTAQVGTRVGIAGGQSLTIDHEGIRGQFNREAVASVTAEARDHVSGRYGEAGYEARATAEARASVDAQGKIDSNGLDATVTLRAGAKVEAEMTASARTNSVSIGGVEMNAGVEGHARVVAEVAAEATGTVKMTRNPPTAVARGTAGASAVAKAEGEVRASAGPFSVVASGYASAGAEARASGVIGYEDGKLKLGGSVGAALGLGLGGGVEVEVDVAQIGEAAKGLADVDGDGELGLGDVVAAARKTVDVARTVARAADVNGDGRVGLDDAAAAARNVASRATTVARNTTAAVARTVVRAADVNGDGRLGLDDVGAAATRTAQQAASVVTNVASGAANVAHNTARRVASWFGF